MLEPPQRKACSPLRKPGSHETVTLLQSAPEHSVTGYLYIRRV